MRRRHQRLTFALAVLVACGSAPLAACSAHAEPATSQQLAVCVPPTETMPAGERVQVEMRLGETVVATGVVPVGEVFQAEVPNGTDIDVYANGRLFGTGGGTQADDAGGGPVVYMSGPGCPTSPAG